jgi:hypothetical protein
MLVIDFVSTAVANDARVVASARRWEVDAATLRYTMSMHTTRVDVLTPHLTAVLSRRCE